MVVGAEGLEPPTPLGVKVIKSPPPAAQSSPRDDTCWPGADTIRSIRPQSTQLRAIGSHLAFNVWLHHRHCDESCRTTR